MSSSPDDLRAARRVLVLFLVALTAATAGAAVLLASRADDGPAASSSGARAIRLGPLPGTAVDTHLRAAADALVSAEGTRVGVVSLTDYVAEDALRALVEDEGLTVRALLVAVPGSPPATVTDVDGFVAAVVRDARSQADEIESLLPTVDDPEFIEFYESELRRYGSVQRRATSDPVFGALVEGEAAALRALASRSSVRSVEPAPAAGLATGASVAGLRPEETRFAGTPEFRPY